MSGILSAVKDVGNPLKNENGPVNKKPLGRAALLKKLRAMQNASEVGRKQLEPEAPSASQPTQLPSDPSETSSSTSSGFCSDFKNSTKPELCVEKGTSGKNIELTTNFIRLNVDSDKPIVEHIVTFHPEVDDRRLQYQLVGSLESVIGRVRSFDGRTLRLPRRLNTTQVVDCPRQTGVKYQVQIKYIKTLALDSAECVQHYNVIFHRIMRVLKMQQLRSKSSFFDPELAIRDENYKLEIWPGFVTAINKVEGGVMLTLDVSHRVLQSCTVFDLFSDVYQSAKNAQGSVRSAMVKAVLGEVVITRYNNKCYRIDDVTFEASPESCFDCRGRNVSFIQYYKESHSIDIKDRTQPLLIHNQHMKGDANAKPVKIFLIPDLCHLTGLRQSQREDFRFMKYVANQTNVSPSAREMKKRDLLQKIKATPEAYRLLLDWGISLADDSVAVTGRVLEPQALLFGQGTEQKVAGDIHRAVRQNKMFKCADLSRWALIYDPKSQSVTRTLCEALRKCEQRLGMRVREPTMIPLANDRSDSYVQAIRKAVGSQPDLILTLVPSKREDRYKAIKNECFVQQGVNNQVVLSKTLQRPGSDNIVLNIAMQINAKLGGQPWAAKSGFRNCMVVGIDVSHDPEMGKKSVAVLVATINREMSRYASYCHEQLAHSELFEGLHICFLKALKRYVDENGSPPDRVIVFRDGVGDGRLDYTRQFEVPQFAAACKNYSPDYKPKMTFVVVSKRIMARFSYQPSPGDFQNPPPGTVVDHTITKTVNNYPNFYLVSQMAQWGTVSPTHYVVLFDDSDIKMDHIQKLSYKLTFLYFNSKDSVRVPAPCLYADRLSKMVGKNLHKLPHRTLADKLFYI